MPESRYPCSPKDEIDGLPYIRRMCGKVRLMEAGELHPDLHANLGLAMDAWACEFLGVGYDALKEAVLSGKSAPEILAWARENGVVRPGCERDWWVAFMRGVGFRDHLAGRLQERIVESGFEGRDDIVTMFDYIDADEAGSGMPLLKILHHDPAFVVVEKESGMLAVPGRRPEKFDSVAYRVRQMFPGCIEQPAAHRLDMDTSGLMVLGLTAEGHRELSRQFLERETRKRYVALLEGKLEGHSGTIELPFRLDLENRPLQMYDEVYGKMGTTHWERMGIEGDVTRVEFVPVTGRTHQLRLHAAHEKGLGIPIVGDPFYGNGAGPGEMKLHACELGFRHPVTGEAMVFRSEPGF